MVRKNYCGNLLWQSSLTLLAPAQEAQVAVAALQASAQGKDVLETAGTDPKKALFFSAFLMSAQLTPLVWASFAGLPPGGDP